LEIFLDIVLERFDLLVCVAFSVAFFVALCSGRYKSPLFPQPDSIDDTLTKKRKTIIAAYNQFTQQISLNIPLSQTEKLEVYPSPPFFCIFIMEKM